MSIFLETDCTKRRCHTALPSRLVRLAYPGLPLVPHHAAGTTLAQPLPRQFWNESTRFDGACCSFSLRTVEQNRSPVSFSFVSFAFPLSPVRSFHSRSSFLIPTSRGDAHLSLFSEHLQSRALSHFHICLSRTHCRCFSVVSRSRRAPHSLSMRSTSTSLPRRRPASEHPPRA